MLVVFVLFVLLFLNALCVVLSVVSSHYFDNKGRLELWAPISPGLWNVRNDRGRARLARPREEETRKKRLGGVARAGGIWEKIRPRRPNTGVSVLPRSL